MLSIKKASIADLVLVQSIAVQTYAETFAESNTQEDMQLYIDNAFSTAQLTKELSSEYSEWFIAAWNHETVGYLKLNFKTAQTEMQDQDAMEVQRIYVLQHYKGKGIGKELLKKAMAVAREANVDFVWLGVWEQNKKAIGFYERSGFVKFGEHCFLLGTDEQTDWLMKRDVAKTGS